MEEGRSLEMSTQVSVSPLPRLALCGQPLTEGSYGPAHLGFAMVAMISVLSRLLSTWPLSAGPGGTGGDLERGKGTQRHHVIANATWSE